MDGKERRGSKKIRARLARVARSLARIFLLVKVPGPERDAG